MPERKTAARDWIRFVVPSVAGISMFLVPLSVGGEPNIGIGVLSDLVEALLEGWLPALVTLIVTVSHPAPAPPRSAA